MKIIEILKKRKENKLVKETFWSIASKATAMILFLLTNIFLMRYLGVENFGVWSLFLSIITAISSISYLGINASTKRYVAKYRGTEKINEVFVDSIRIRIVASFAFAFLLLIAYAFYFQAADSKGFSKLFLLAVPLLFFNGILEYVKAFFIGLHRIKYNFYITVLDFGLKLLLVVIIVPLFGEIVSIVWAYVLAVATATLFGLVMLYRKFIDITNVKRDLFKKSIIKYSVPMFIIGIGFLIATELDTIMIGFLRDNHEVGIYAAAKQIIAKLPQISIALSMGVLPIFAKLNNDNARSLKKIFYKLTNFNAALFCFIGLFIVLFAGIFIPFLLGEEYTESVLIVRLLTPYLIIYSITVYYSGFLNYRGLAKKRAKNLLWSLILNVVLNFVLIPKYGASGAAVATSVSYLPHLILNWLQTNKEFKKFRRKEGNENFA